MYEDRFRLSKPPLRPNDDGAGAGDEVWPMAPDDWRCDTDDAQAWDRRCSNTN